MKYKNYDCNFGCPLKRALKLSLTSKSEATLL